MTLSRPPRGHYTEAEVARALDLSLEDLRALVRQHILDKEEDAANLPITCYQPSDLLLLRLIVSERRAAA